VMCEKKCSIFKQDVASSLYSYFHCQLSGRAGNPRL
jgi:hypothetical protein